MKSQLVWALVILLVVAVGIIGRRRLIVVTVEGESMSPTLIDGQRILVLRVRPSKLRLYDIVVFTVPTPNTRENEPVTAIKRITGIEGVGLDRRFFLTGDCSERSADSRHFGWVPATQVIARQPGGNGTGRARFGGRTWA